MSFGRTIEPELLDELPPSDARALRSRRDLKRINVWMRQTAILTCLFMKYSGPAAGPRPTRIIELGAGDGTLMLSVAKRLAPRWPDVTLVLLDRQDIVSAGLREEFRALGWRMEAVTADVFDFLEAQKPDAADIIAANLFLHHFSNAQLARLFQSAARTAPCFLACEPERSSFALGASHMLFAIGCNDVTRHDAVVSVRAGFGARELSQLWPAEAGWTLHERPAFPFTHCFAAQRSHA